jgi:hypothetical protein
VGHLGPGRRPGGGQKDLGSKTTPFPALGSLGGYLAGKLQYLEARFVLSIFNSIIFGYLFLRQKQAGQSRSLFQAQAPTKGMRAGRGFRRVKKNARINQEIFYA